MWGSARNTEAHIINVGFNYYKREGLMKKYKYEGITFHVEDNNIVGEHWMIKVSDKFNTASIQWHTGDVKCNRVGMSYCISINKCVFGVTFTPEKALDMACEGLIMNRVGYDNSIDAYKALREYVENLESI